MLQAHANALPRGASVAGRARTGLQFDLRSASAVGIDAAIVRVAQSDMHSAPREGAAVEHPDLTVKGGIVGAHLRALTPRGAALDVLACGGLRRQGMHVAAVEVHRRAPRRLQPAPAKGGVSEHHVSRPPAQTSAVTVACGHNGPARLRTVSELAHMAASFAACFQYALVYFLEHAHAGIVLCIDDMTLPT